MGYCNEKRDVQNCLQSQLATNYVQTDKGRPQWSTPSELIQHVKFANPTNLSNVQTTVNFSGIKTGSITNFFTLFLYLPIISHY